MAGGAFVARGDETISPRGEARGRITLPQPLTPVFKICDLCAVQEVNINTNTHKHT